MASLTVLKSVYLFVILNLACCLKSCDKDYCVQHDITEMHEDKRLVGYNFANVSSTLEDHIKGCLLHCSLNCKCVSVNVRSRSNNEKECELNYETAKDKDPRKMVHTEGYKYFEVEMTHESECDDPGTCDNSCCYGNPCKHEGTCIELCNHTQYKFNCTCKRGFLGRLCEDSVIDQMFDLNFVDGSLTDYLERNLDMSHDLEEFTLSLWFKLGERQTSFPSLFSYAIPTDSNVLVLMYKENGVDLYLNGKKVDVSYTLTKNNWHHVLITWKNVNGEVQIYVDGVPVLSKSDFLIGVNLSGSGLVVLGQEQDSVGGGFSTSQAYIGQLTGVNLWDRVLSKYELQELFNRCHSVHVGNRFTWSEALLSGKHGNVGVVKPSSC